MHTSTIAIRTLKEIKPHRTCRCLATRCARDWRTKLLNGSFFLACIGALLLACQSQVSAEELRPTESDRAVTRTVIGMLERKHLLKQDVSRALASQAVDSYLNSVDPLKLYFLQSDIEEFNRRKMDQAEELKEGDIAIAFDIYRRFQLRVAEAEKIWSELLGPGAIFDFTTAEVVVVDSKARTCAKDQQVLREQWRLWIKYSLLAKKTAPENRNFDLATAREEIAASYARSARQAKLTKNFEVMEDFLNAVAGVYDTGSRYTSAASVARYQENMRGHFVGIGAVLLDGGVISSLTAGGPADLDGRLQPKDTIVSVGSSAGTMKDVTKLTLNELVAMVRGAEGTTVHLGIRKAGESQPKTIALRRGKVVLPETKVESRVERVEEKKVGYLDVPGFYLDEKAGESTATDVRKLLERFTSQSVDVVVLDLRRCTGGYVSQVVELSGLFVGKGPIFQDKNRDGVMKNGGTSTTAKVWSKPLVVLTGRYTAGGAETICAAVQDYKRGLIVGDESTFGLGLLRSQLDAGSAAGFLIVSTAQMYRVNGDAIQLKGVKPDLVIRTNNIRAKNGSSVAPNLVPDQVSSLSVTAQNPISMDTILSLRAHSREWRRESPEFKLLQTWIEWQEGQRDRTIETLSEQDYRAKLRQGPTETLPKSKPGVSDYYLQEVFAVAVDYISDGRSSPPSSSGLTSGAPRTASPPSTPKRVAVAPPLSEDPAAIRRRELATQIEAARQTVEGMEDEMRIMDKKLADAQAAVAMAKKNQQGSFARLAPSTVAQSGYLAALRSLTDLEGDRDRAKAELQAARDRYNRLRQ